MFYHDGYAPLDTMLNIESDSIIDITLISAPLPDSFFDDFESGPGQWIGGWHITDAEFHSGSYSFTDSPEDNYSPYTNDSVMAIPGIDLSEYLGASISFWTRYMIEESFDFGHLEVSIDTAQTWVEIASYTGEYPDWHQETIDLGGFVGEDNVKIRFRLTSDGALQMDGWYIDDVVITGSDVDTSAPLIIHTPISDTVPKTGDISIVVEIRDISGVSEAYINYKFDDESYTMSELPDSNIDNLYYFTIPESGAGTFVKYYFTASDGATPTNTANSPEFEYISGIPLFYDDGDADYIADFTSGDKIAVRFSPPDKDSVRVTTALLRFYTDPEHDLDSVYFHIWNDVSGNPGLDIIESFKMFPMNTQSTPELWTPVDLRDYAIDLESDFHIGCEFISSLPVILYDSPGLSGRSNANYSGYWQAFGGDFHIRAIVGPSPEVSINESEDNIYSFRLHQNVPNPFTKETLIRYSIPSKSIIRIEVFDITGRKLITLVDEKQKKGSYNITWNGRDARGENISAGIYFLKLTAGNMEISSKLIHLR